MLFLQKKMCKETTKNSVPPTECSEFIENINVTVTEAIDLEEIPLSALETLSRDKLSNYLDRRMHLKTSNGLFRDWRGIWYLSGLIVENEAKLESNQTCQLINLLEEQQPDLTMGAFVKMLREIDRHDVVADTLPLLEHDAAEFKKKLLPQQITILDAKFAEQDLPFQQYDGFILYVDEDADFAAKILEEMKVIPDQVQDSKRFKLCCQQDFLPGVNFESEAVREFLSLRCDRLIVIFSPDFLDSNLYTFLLDLAQNLGLEKDVRKIIPCFHKWCQLPEIFHHIKSIDYERSKKFGSSNFWDKLRSSFDASTTEPRPTVRYSITDLDIQELKRAKKKRSLLRSGLKFTRKFIRRR